MRFMSRGALAALLVGWLLGIATAFAIPTLVYQRQSVEGVGPGGLARLRAAIEDGWVVVRTDDRIYTGSTHETGKNTR